MAFSDSTDADESSMDNTQKTYPEGEDPDGAFPSGTKMFSGAVGGIGKESLRLMMSFVDDLPEATAHRGEIIQSYRQNHQ